MTYARCRRLLGRLVLGASLAAPVGGLGFVIWLAFLGSTGVRLMRVPSVAASQ